MGIDLLRSCYSTEMHFPGIGNVGVEWYFCKEGTPLLDVPTVFNSLNWHTEKVRPPDTPGEVSGSARKWSNGKSPENECDKSKGSKDAWLGKPGPKFKCHVELLANGGLELCGHAMVFYGDAFDGDGGSSVGGSGGFELSLRGSGGLSFGGAGRFSLGYLGYGGLSFGGSGSWDFAYKPSMGLKVGMDWLETPPLSLTVDMGLKVGMDVTGSVNPVELTPSMGLKVGMDSTVSTNPVASSPSMGLKVGMSAVVTTSP